MSDELIKRGLNSLYTEIPLPFDSLVADRINFLIDSKMPEINEAGVKLSQYSSIIEKEIELRRMPQELIYLPFAISFLQPDFKNNFNRAGIWGLTPAIAARSGLRISYFWDERMDVALSTPVALNHLQNLYIKYNDWWYAIIAFCNGETGLSNTITRIAIDNPQVLDFYYKGGLTVKNIITDFIATAFIVNYVIDNEIADAPQENIIKVFLKEKMKKRDLLVVTNLNAKQFELLNPVYIAEALHPHPTIPILLPAALETVFRLSEDSLYAAFCLKTDTAEKANDNKNAIQVISSANYQTIPAQPEYIIYSVKQGDMLGRIAEKHGVSLKKLKKWNKLKGDIIHPGQKLKIYK